MDIKLTGNKVKELVDTLPQQAKEWLLTIRNKLNAAEGMFGAGELTREEFENFLLVAQWYIDQKERGL